MKKKPTKSTNEHGQQSGSKNFKTNGMSQGLGPNIDQNFMGDMPQGPYYQSNFDMNNGYHYQGHNPYDMDSN